VLHRALQAAQQQFDQGERRRQPLITTVQEHLSQVPLVQPQYVELVHPETLQPLETITSMGLLGVAAYLGPTRAD
jgi:pantoate ligase/cytidylate kinase